MKDKNFQIAYLISTWQKDHVLGFEQLFGIKLDEQQRNLVRCAQKTRARVAVKSGTGCGKTFTLAGLTYLYLLIFNNVRIMTPSPSYQQLSRVYRTELDVLYSMMHEDFKPFFKDGLFKERVELNIPGEKPRVCDLVTANPANETSLQGGHTKGGPYIILLDEASGVEDIIYQILLRTLTTPETKFICTSNPTKNQGFFYDIFQKEIEGWDRITFNGFDSAHVDDEWIKEMASTFGEDSDTYRIGVLGEFGRIGENSFFPAHIIDGAYGRKCHVSDFGKYPKITGVDVAGGGKDKTVFLTRQGPFIIDIERHQGLDSMEVTAALVQYSHRISPAKIYVDAHNFGSGVGPRGRELGLNIEDVLVASRSPNPTAYFNLRAWLYGEVRSWLANGGCIPEDEDLRKDLMNCMYTHSGKLAIQIIAKHIMRSKGFDSPDTLDALSFTMVDNIYMQAVRNVQPRKIKAANYLYV